MGEEKESDYYDKVFNTREIYNIHYKDSPYWVHWTQVIKFLNLIISKDDRILDVGCGPGQFAAYLYSENFKNYSGFDFSHVAVKKAAEEVSDFHFFQGDALDARSYDQEYDVVTCLEVLEHIEKDLEILKQIKEGKYVIFSVPNFREPSHVRRFTSFRQVKKRYYRLIDIQRITRIDNIYIAYGIRSNFKPNFSQYMLKSREKFKWQGIFARVRSYWEVFLDAFRQV